MGINQDIATGVVAVALPLLSLSAVWLRLHFQLRRQHERRRYLLAAAATLPAGTRVHDHSVDGDLTITVGAARRPRE